MRRKFQTSSICRTPCSRTIVRNVRVIVLLSIGFTGVPADPLTVSASDNVSAPDNDDRQRTNQQDADIGPADARSCPAAIPDDPARQTDVERLLANLDPTTDAAANAVPLLLAVLQNPASDPVVRERSAKMLARIGEPARDAIPLLVQILKAAETSGSAQNAVSVSTGQTAVPYWAMKSLGLFGTVAADAVPAIAAILKDQDTSAELRILAADTLGQIASPAAAGVLTMELMKPRVDDENSSVVLRQTIIDSLALTGPLATGSIPALTRAAEDSYAGIRRKACEAIGALGPRAEGGLSPLLERLILDDDPAVKDAAADALAQLGMPAVQPLTDLLEQGEPELQWRAARALGLIGITAKPSVPQLTRTFTSPSARARMEAINSIWKITGNARLIEAPLVIELSSEDRQIRRRAAQLLIEPDSLSEETSETLNRLSQSGRDHTARAAEYVIRERARRTDQ